MRRLKNWVFALAVVMILAVLALGACAPSAYGPSAYGSPDTPSFPGAVVGVPHKSDSAVVAQGSFTVIRRFEDSGRTCYFQEGAEYFSGNGGGVWCTP